MIMSKKKKNENFTVLELLNMFVEKGIEVRQDKEHDVFIIGGFPKNEKDYKVVMSDVKNP